MMIIVFHVILIYVFILTCDDDDGGGGSSSSVIMAIIIADTIEGAILYSIQVPGNIRSSVQVQLNREQAEIRVL